MNRIAKIVAAGIVAATVFFAADSPQYSGRNDAIDETRTSAVSLETITFDEARKDESKRQQYIDQIIQQHGKPDYLIKVIYDPNEDGHCEHEAAQIYDKIGLGRAVLMTGPMRGTYKDIGQRSLPIRTRVTRMAFEQETEEFFRVGLLSHERTVAKCLHEGFSKVSTDILYFQEDGRQKILSDALTLLLEVEAYSADIDFCRQNNASSFQTNFDIDKFKTYYALLKKYAEAAPEHLRAQLETAVKAYERKDIN